MRPLLGGKKVRQKPSHARLLRTIADPPPSRPSKLDAIIVPASRPASSLSGLIDLSARLGTLLVVLCSLQTRVDGVAARVARTPGARALLVEVPRGFEIPDMPTRTSSAEFTRASGDRVSDLSTKRNLGLLLARLNGWNKIAFLDDDITLRDPTAYLRVARQLEHSSIAGMICREYPDNSVACHARRLAKLPQDNFVSGSVLGVRCGDPTLPFFPDIYNEDWFFFSRAVAKHDLLSAGVATQTPYEPFANPRRAAHEEFGDLLAEGLYALIGAIGDPKLAYHSQLRYARGAFWKDFLEARREGLHLTRDHLKRLGAVLHGGGVADHALGSLETAEHQLDQITPDLCDAFLDAWQDDLVDWETLCLRTGYVGSMREAMGWFDKLPWRIAKFGGAHIDGSDHPTMVGSSAYPQAEPQLVPAAG
jgi:hypothetical protein